MKYLVLFVLLPLSFGAQAGPSATRPGGGSSGGGFTSLADYPDICGANEMIVRAGDDLSNVCAANIAGGAGTGLSYITKTAEGTLSNEFALGSLGTGLLINTTTTGIPTVSTGTTCPANQVITAISATGVPTCTELTDSYVPDGITVAVAQLAAASVASTQFTVDPPNCQISGELAVGINAFGQSECAALSDTYMPDNLNVTGWDLGTSTATTQSANDNTTNVATTAYVKNELAGVSYDHYDIAWKAMTSTDSVLIGEVAATSHAAKLACLANGGSGLTGFSIEIQECNSSAASCQSIGASVTISAVDTLVSDTSFSGVTLEQNNWLKAVISSYNWTDPGFVTCSFRTTIDD